MTKERLDEILKEHEKWLRTRFCFKVEGSRANLYGADLCEANLYEANLRGADLREADLRGADLREADLYGANLYGANLREADLYGADLYGANLREADLYGADLRGADLREADLREADLRGANLYGADLREANLRGADLRGADLREANLRDTIVNLACPEKGSFIGFKKAMIHDRDVIVELMISEDAKRTSATTRKCRCSKAKVLSITSVDGKTSYEEACSRYNKKFIYKIGEVVEVTNFEEDRFAECAAGIHFFITRKEAEEY
jgi:hypothetical protein